MTTDKYLVQSSAEMTLKASPPPTPHPLLPRLQFETPPLKSVSVSVIRDLNPTYDVAHGSPCDVTAGDASAGPRQLSRGLEWFGTQLS